jgi:hypothetical protein
MMELRIEKKEKSKPFFKIFISNFFFSFTFILYFVYLSSIIGSSELLLVLFSLQSPGIMALFAKLHYSMFMYFFFFFLLFNIL